MSNTQSEELIVAPQMTDNQTWNTCPKCLRNWITIPAIPGVIHRTRYCDECKKDMEEEVFGHMREDKKQ